MTTADQIAAAFIASHAPPPTAQEALLAVVGAYADSLTHSQRARLAESVTRITALSAWPVQRAGDEG